MFSNSFHKKYLANTETESVETTKIQKDIYYKKYLNYKQKYMNLKSHNVMTGGASTQNKLYLFKAEWCGHCQNFKSTWSQLQKEMKDHVEFVTYDADNHKNEIKKYNIQGFPTLILHTGSKAVEYNGQRDINSLKDFIKEYN
jgi:thiol-disulfide isomerase/thioredoxin